jgi:hypothetical protein
MMQFTEQQVIVTESRYHPRSKDGCNSEMERPKKRVRFSSVIETLVLSYKNNQAAAIQGDDAATDGTNQLKEQNESSTPLSDAERRRNEYRTWLSRRDLAYFRSCAKKMCMSINLDNALYQAYDDREETAEADLEKTLALLSNDDYDKQRGLERWSSREHAFFRSTKIIEVKTAVILEQSMQMLKGESDADRLAMIAQAASLTSQRFAQVLALTDAALAMQVQEGSRAA